MNGQGLLQRKRSLRGKCNSCGAAIWWVTVHKTGRPAPINAQGVNHFADCPHAEKHRKAARS